MPSPRKRTTKRRTPPPAPRPLPAGYKAIAKLPPDYIIPGLITMAEITNLEHLQKDYLAKLDVAQKKAFSSWKKKQRPEIEKIRAKKDALPQQKDAERFAETKITPSSHKVASRVGLKVVGSAGVAVLAAVFGVPAAVYVGIASAVAGGVAIPRAWKLLGAARHYRSATNLRGQHMEELHKDYVKSVRTAGTAITKDEPLNRDSETDALARELKQTVSTAETLADIENGSRRAQRIAQWVERVGSGLGVIVGIFDHSLFQTVAAGFAAGGAISTTYLYHYSFRELGLEAKNERENTQREEAVIESQAQSLDNALNQKVENAIGQIPDQLEAQRAAWPAAKAAYRSFADEVIALSNKVETDPIMSNILGNAYDLSIHGRICYLKATFALGSYSGLAPGTPDADVAKKRDEFTDALQMLNKHIHHHTPPALAGKIEPHHVLEAPQL